MTPAEKARARELLARATPGPWRAELSREPPGGIHSVHGGPAAPGYRGPNDQLAITSGEQGRADAALIAAAPSLLSTALDSLDAAEESFRLSNRDFEEMADRCKSESERADAAEAEVERLTIKAALLRFDLSDMWKRADAAEARRDELLNVQRIDRERLQAAWQERARLQARVAELEREIADGGYLIRVQSRASDRVDALEAALRTYGRHIERGCGLPHRTPDGEEPVRIWYDPCVCGLDAALGGE